MKISYYALGCKVNLYEITTIVNKFVDAGFKLVDFNEAADVCIINTCTVTATSDSKSRKIIRQAAKKNPNAVIAVMGCFSQLYSEQVKKIENVDIVIGTSNRSLLYDMIMKRLDENENKCDDYIIATANNNTTYEEIKLDRYDNKIRGFVKIEDGCSNFCSYCAIPYARGPVKSRNSDNVISEIQALVNNGMNEIVLTGINTGAYGSDLSDIDFPTLLEKIIKNVQGLGRIRISSIEVTEITDDFLNVISKYSKHFCEHFHIPLQGGSNKILKAMNRKYDLDLYKNKIEAIRKIFPLCNITTDIMVGFSGETDVDFDSLIEFVNIIKYGEMHVFPYSRRINTVAYNLPNQVNEEIKHKRVEKLLKINYSNALEYRNRFLNDEVQVIVEKNENGICTGHSSNYLMVEFEGDNILPNSLVAVTITKPGYPVSIGTFKGEIKNEF